MCRRPCSGASVVGQMVNVCKPHRVLSTAFAYSYHLLLYKTLYLGCRQSVCAFRLYAVRLASRLYVAAGAGGV